VDPRRNYQLGHWLRRAKSAWRLHAHLRIPRMDKSDSAVLSIAAVALAVCALVTRAAPIAGHSNRPPNYGPMAPSSGAVSQVQSSGKI